MRYGIMINLDYESNPYDKCRELWQAIRNAMVDAGFRIEGRLFTIEMPPQDACDLARSVIESIDVPNGGDIFTYLKEFYGYDHAQTVNLLLPPSDALQLMED